MERPVLTMPEIEGAYLRGAFSRASNVLEYGAGGSTAMVAEMNGKTVFSVESDRDWVAMMQDWFARTPPAKDTSVQVLHADIGPTKAWGFPVNNARCRDFPGYALDIWRLEDMPQPDLVFVDGRFRVGCILATAVQTKAPLTLLVDDYIDRPNYHLVESHIGRPEMVGRLAVFDLEPLSLTADVLADLARHLVIPS